MCAASGDLAGRTFLVTGGNTGIGRATAAGLARRGGRVYVACRSPEKGRAAVADIVAATGNGAVTFVPLDLADLASVRRCAQEFLALAEPLHVLINNAGVAGRRGVTADGFELAFGVNHLGHFALTAALLDRLADSVPARVVTVASDAHYQAGGVNCAAVRQRTASVTARLEYAVSKLCNVLFSAELARPGAAAGHHQLRRASWGGGLRHLAAGPVAGPPADQAADDVARAGRQDVVVLRHLGPGWRRPAAGSTRPPGVASPAPPPLRTWPAPYGNIARRGSRPDPRPGRRPPAAGPCQARHRRRGRQAYRPPARWHRSSRRPGPPRFPSRLRVLRRPARPVRTGTPSAAYHAHPDVAGCRPAVMSRCQIAFLAADARRSNRAVARLGRVWQAGPGRAHPARL